MRIALPFYEGLIFQHFGHSKQFKIYEIENHQVLMECIVAPEGSGHEAVAELLRSMDVRVVICGNIGEGAMEAVTDLLAASGYTYIRFDHRPSYIRVPGFGE